MSIAFSISDRAGDVNLSERDKNPDKHGGWNSTPLIDTEIKNNIDLDIYVNEDTSDSLTHSDTGLCELQLNASHIANEETGRVFHAHLTIQLGRSEIRRLAGYLTFILDHTE